ncbi:MAG: hypothetical protein WCT04_00610 [Planctomycetota bacterium]
MSAFYSKIKMSSDHAVAGDQEQAAMEFLRRLIDAQKQMHCALACADADAIGEAVYEIESILENSRNIRTSTLLPDQIKERQEARVLVETVSEWQQQSRELTRHSMRLLRRLCGSTVEPSYTASGQLDESQVPQSVGICA